MSSIFFRFLRHPFEIGACCASSACLARALTSGLGLEQAANVVELGPGTGVITAEILRQLPPEGKLMAIELDPVFAEEIRRKFPEVLLCRGCASRIGEFLKENGLPPPGAVISGLPWAIFPEELQEKILRSVAESLPDGGVFTTFAYVQGLLLPAGIRFRRLLRKTFRKVECSRPVLCNFPPALVYRCRK